MSRHIFCILILGLLWSIPFHLFASDLEFSVRRISPEGGFTLSPVLKISQDKHGFIWFITREKLYQYNSQEFISFNPELKTALSQTNNYITSMLIDRSNTIWVGSNTGIARFNQLSGQIETVDLIDNELPGRTFNVSDIKQNRHGEIWILEGASLARIDSASKKVAYLQLNQTRLNVNAFCFDDKGNIFAGNNQGEMFHVDTRTLHVKLLPFTISPIKLHGIFLINDTLWITSDGFGLRRYTIDGTLLDIHFLRSSEASVFSTNRIREVLQTSDGKIWIATYKGLLEWNEGKFRYYQSEADNSNSLPDNSVISLFEDNQKGLWAGTWRGGLAYLNKFSNKFETYQHSPYGNSICGNVVNAIAVDAAGAVWIGTDDSGVDVFDDRLKTFKHFNLTSSDQSAATTIKCICTIPNGDIWIGTFGKGIFVRKSRGSSFKPALLSNTNVYDLVADDTGMWIATYNNGLFYYRFNSSSLEHYTNNSSGSSSLPSNFLRKLLLDRYQNLWIISNAGLSIKPKGKKAFEQLLIEQDPGSGSLQIYTITSDLTGTLWLGTDHGILSMDSLRNISRHPLLFNGKAVSVYGIVSISPKQMWLSSNYGIFSYDPITGNYLNYSTLDGLPGNLFNAGAVSRSLTGKIYFGSTTGLIAFNPSRIQVNPFYPQVYFSKLFINHKEVLLKQENPLLSKPLYETETLRLKPGQNSFSIEFVALNYLIPQKNQFRYRLKGFDQNWVESGNISRAIYTNISPGEYIFEVVACNNDGIWNQEPAKLSIIVARHIMSSKMAQAVYLLMLVMLGLLIRRIILYRSRLEHQIELERVQRKQEEMLHQSKLMFFTNISHELRTPLTLITGPVESLMKSPNLDQSQFNQLNLIRRNAGRLLNLINQLLEFRKIENNKMELKVGEFNLVKFVRNIFDHFLDLARQKKIKFEFVSIYDDIKATFDADKMDKAIFNLLSNALKFTPEKGSVHVEVTKGEKIKREIPRPNIFLIGKLAVNQYVQISVGDNGPGFEPEYRERIFERFYKVENGETIFPGSGIGLHLTKQLILLHGGEIEVESVSGKGSIFRIRIPYEQPSTRAMELNPDIVVHELSNNGHPGKFDIEKSKKDFALSENWSESEKHPRKSRKLILVVEDHHDLRNFVCSVLEPDYRIVPANNGKEGIEKARTFLPDLIISDILMPDKNGMEMVRELKTDMNTSHIPIILLTALTSTQHKIEGFSLGADDYIEKPFNSDLLKARVRNILANREAMQLFYVGKIAQGFDQVSDSPDQRLLVKAIRFVENNIVDEHLDIDLLAKHLNLSRSTLHRKLKALTNKSATDFIRTIKLEFAAKLLKEGRDNIDEVSSMSGFNSHSYFTRSFKEYFGKTPTEFLAQHHK